MALQSRPKKQLWIIVAIVFFGFVGLSMPYLIFPSLFLDPSSTIVPFDWGQGSRSIFLGITLAAYPFGQFLGSPILGALSDDYGRKKILTGSLVITAGCTLLTALSIEGRMVWLLILSRFVAGIMEGNLAIARSMAADIKQLSKHVTFGRINAATSIAFIVGPLLGGLLSDDSIYPAFTLSTPFFIICTLYLGLGVISHYMVTETVRLTELKKRTIWERINFVRRLRVLFYNKRLKFLLIMATMFTLSVDIFYEFAPVYLTVKWMIGPAELAIYNGVLCIGLTISSGWLVGYLSTRCRDRIIETIALIGFVATALGIVLVDQHLLMLFLFLAIGFAIGFSTTNLTVKVSDSAPDDIQGEVMGVQTSLRVLGDAIICLLGGALLLISPKIILIIAAIIALVMAYFYLNKKPTSTNWSKCSRRVAKSPAHVGDSDPPYFYP